MRHSLEKDGAQRATPWSLLERHPFMEEIGPKKVNVERFLKEVWDWKD